jgi:hypothetical protein
MVGFIMVVNGYSVQTDHLFPRQIDHLFSGDDLFENGP